jgi:hypothetical protein
MIPRYYLHRTDTDLGDRLARDVEATIRMVTNRDLVSALVAEIESQGVGYSGDNSPTIRVGKV